MTVDLHDGIVKYVKYTMRCDLFPFPSLFFSRFNRESSQRWRNVTETEREREALLQCLSQIGEYFSMFCHFCEFSDVTPSSTIIVRLYCTIYVCLLYIVYTNILYMDI